MMIVFFKYSEGFAQDLSESAIYFDEVEKFFSAKAWDDKDRVEKFLDDYEKNLCDIVESNCQKMKARLSSFDNEVTAYLEEHLAEVTAAQAQNNLFFSN